MNLVECKDQADWIEKINTWIEEKSTSYAVQNIFLPAGETPRPLYRFWTQSEPPFSSSCRLIQIDEILDGDKAGMFRAFFQETLPLLQVQFEYISLADKIPDLAILGLGMNGHIAFHEPGVNENFFSGCLDLNIETAMHLNLSARTKVISYGLGAFMHSKSIALIVRGVKKKLILKSVLENSSVLPASRLKDHEDLHIFTDFMIN